MSVKRILSSREYKKIYALVPNICVDILLVRRGQFLLCKRVHKPAQGQWFLPGGRVRKWEALKVAVVRKAREELGVRIKKDECVFLTVTESFFLDSRLGGSIHNITIVFVVHLKRSPMIRLNPQDHSDLRWFSNVNPRWHHEVKHALLAAGFRA